MLDFQGVPFACSSCRLSHGHRRRGLFFSAPAATAATLPSTNIAHHCVHHTTGVCGWTHNKKPKDKYETAKCKDASLSYSRHSQGTCSHHHGVRYWFK
ncbi:DUF3761 domain-containing protein [Streptomyces sp. NPDC020792]|uniref:DUF3761 domain-containing protein n=1 Tax=Streptomyces sp. NPDC020792 TaxID=3365089 RepID=UPI00379B72DB